MRGKPRTSARVTSHFGELIQGPYQLDGSWEYSLVTLPCRALSTEMSLTGSRYHSIGPRTRQLWESLHEQFDLPLAYRISKRSNIPIGKGLGSSTSDLFCAGLLFEKVYRKFASMDQLFTTCTGGEVASDPLHLDFPAIFAQQKKSVLARIKTVNTNISFIGTFSKEADQIETEALAIRKYSEDHVKAYNVSKALLSYGLASGCARSVAHACAISAEMNADFVHLKDFKEIFERQSKLGAFGYAISHSGPAISLMFDDPEKRDKALPKLKEDGYDAFAFEERV